MKAQWDHERRDWQAQRDIEMAAAQQKLQDGYDLKLAELERMSQDDNVDAATVEAQFAKVTKEYEESKVTVAEKIMQHAPPPPNPTPLGPAPAPPPPQRGPAATALNVATEGRAQWEEERRKWQQGREAEMAKAEVQLQAEYDRKLAELEHMSQDDTVEASVVEAQFAKVTEEYEQSKKAAAAQLEKSQPPPPPPPTETTSATTTSPTKSANSTAGPSTTAARPTPATPAAKAVVVVGADGMPVVSLLGADGVYLKATIGEDGQLRPILDAANNPEVLLGPDGQPAQMLSLSPSRPETPESPVPPPQVVRFVPATVIGPDGEVTPALIGPDGRAVYAEVNDDGVFEPVTNELGEFECVSWDFQSGVCFY